MLKLRPAKVVHADAPEGEGSLQARHPVTEMSLEELKSIVAQAKDLGISVIGLIGGEPLLRRQDILALARSFPDILFPVVTNGLLIDESVLADLAGCGNIISFISFEGFRPDTDDRRGLGVYDRLLAVCSRMRSRILFYGCAVTVTRNNIREVLGESFVRTMIEKGVRSFIYIQYVPTEPGTGDLSLTPEQRILLNGILPEFHRKYPALFITIPGDITAFGGCLAAGRGFVHVSPSGNLEPCPMVPFSDVNLRNVPLKEALRSCFLERIRQNHVLLKAEGSCALRTNPDWVQELLSAK